MLRPLPSPAVVAVFIFFDSLAQSTAFPVLPRLAQTLLDGDPVATARWVGWLEVGWALPFFFAAPILGALSDRFGRRPIIMLGALGVGLELVINVLAPNVWWLLFGRVLVGISFGSQAAAMAYVADTTAPEQRTAAFARVNAALYGGIILGPLLGGWLAGFDIRAPFWAASAAGLAAFAYAMLLLPESLPETDRAPFRFASNNPGSALALLFGRPELRVLAIVLTLSWLALQSSDNMLVLYTAHRYGWSAFSFGVFVTAMALLGLAAQAWLAETASRRFGDRTLLLGGLALAAAGMLAMGLAPSAWLFCVVAPVAVLGGLARPALQSLMSKRADPHEQGRLQGAIAALTGLVSIVAPIVFTQMYAWSIEPGRPAAWSGGTLLSGAVLSAAALAFAAIGLAGRRRADLA